MKAREHTLVLAAQTAMLSDALRDLARSYASPHAEQIIVISRQLQFLDAQLQSLAPLQLIPECRSSK